MKRQNNPQNDHFRGYANQRKDHQNSRDGNVTNRRTSSQQTNVNQPNDRYKDGSNHSNKQYYEYSTEKTDKSRSQRTNNNRVMPYKRLEELIAKYSTNPTDLLLNLRCDDSFLNLISNHDKMKGKFGDYQFFCNVIQALSLISECDGDLIIPYFEKINAKHFQLSIVGYLGSFTHFVNTRNRELHKNGFENLVKFLASYQIILQKSSATKLSLIVNHLDEIKMKCYNRERVISQKSVELIEMIVNANDKISTKHFDEMIESLEDKNDFRKVSIFPTTEDIHSFERPLIRKNIVIGKYDSYHHYLDIQFRLLREDFVRPLREGINEYLERLRENKPMKRLNDIRIYNNVRITGSQFRNGLIHSATFNIKDYKHVRWQVGNDNSK